MAGKPSFLRDPDQAAELAALLRDTADSEQLAYDAHAGEMDRRTTTAQAQTIARYRRWADELDPELAEAEPEARPLHIRPAREEHKEATG
jgi:hypothetical protein